MTAAKDAAILHVTVNSGPFLAGRFSRSVNLLAGEGLCHYNTAVGK